MYSLKKTTPIFYHKIYTYNTISSASANILPMAHHNCIPLKDIKAFLAIGIPIEEMR